MISTLRSFGILSLLLSLLGAQPALSQATINARQVTVDGQRLDTAVAAKADKTAVEAALATKAPTSSVTAVQQVADQASAAAIAKTDKSWIYDTNAAELIRGSFPLVKFLPPSVRAEVLAGTNLTTDIAPYINQAVLHHDTLDLQGLPILVKSSITISGRKRIFGNGAIITSKMPSPTTPTFTTYDDPVTGAQYGAQLFLKDVRINGANTAIRLRMRTNSGIGLGLVLESVVLDGTDAISGAQRVAGTRALDLAMVDFVSVRNSVIRNFDTSVVFGALRATATASVTAGSKTITITAIPSNILAVGSPITCAGYTSGQTVVSDGAGGGPGTFTLNNPATATGTGVACTVMNTRGNTQNVLDTVGIEHTNQALFAEKSDKLVLTRVDVYYAGGGFKFGGYLDRVRCNQCHVENIAFSGSAESAGEKALGVTAFGKAYELADNAKDSDVILDQSDFINTGLSGAGAIAAVYRGMNNDGSTSALTIRNSSFAPTVASAPGYAPIMSHGQLKWEGPWPYGILSSFNMVFTDYLTDPFADVTIDEGPFGTRYAPVAMLPGNKASNLRKKSGTVIVAEDTDAIVNKGHLVSFTGAGEVYETVSLTTGWYSLFVTGYPKTGGGSAVSVSVRTDDANLFTRTRMQINNGGVYERPMRLPFYVANNETVRIGLRSSGTASAVIGSVMLYKGFVTQPTVSAGTWQYPPVLTLPPCSAAYEGQGLTLLGAANDNHQHVCSNSTGGYVWRQVG